MVIILSECERRELASASESSTGGLSSILHKLERFKEGSSYFADIAEIEYYMATIMLKALCGPDSIAYCRFKELGRLQKIGFDREVENTVRVMSTCAATQVWSS